MSQSTAPTPRSAEGLVRLRGDDADAFCAVVNEHLQWSIALAGESH